MSTQQKRNRASFEYLSIPVSANVTLSQTVQVAITRDQPEAGDWQTATWQGSAGTTRTARIGPIGPLATGDWLVFVRITDSPEIPVLLAGSLLIT